MTFIKLCRDGGGTIDAGEIEEMVRALFLMSGLEVEEEEVESSTTDIIQAIDVDCEGEITMVTTKLEYGGSITCSNCRMSLLNTPASLNSSPDCWRNKKGK